MALINKENINKIVHIDDFYSLLSKWIKLGTYDLPEEYSHTNIDYSSLYPAYKISDELKINIDKKLSDQISCHL